MLFVRFFKLACVFTFAAGVIGAIMPGLPFQARRRFVFWLAAPGFGGTWGLGFILVALTRQTVLSAWILASLLVSFVSMNALLYIVGREERYGARPALLALAGLVVTLALMVWRPTL